MQKSVTKNTSRDSIKYEYLCFWCNKWLRKTYTLGENIDSQKWIISVEDFLTLNADFKVVLNVNLIQT